MRKEGSENLTFTERIESKRQRGGVEGHLRSLCELMAEWSGGRDSEKTDIAKCNKG